MKRGNILGVIFLIAFLAVMPSAQAFMTKITINTYQNHTVAINVLDPRDKSTRDHFSGNSGESGIFVLNYDAPTTMPFALMTLVSKDKKFVVSPKIFGNFTVGDDIEFDLFLGAVKKVLDESAIENLTTNSTEAINQTETSSNITESNITSSEENNSIDAGIVGSAISEPEESSTKKIAYFIIAIAVLLGAFIGLVVMKQKSSVALEQPEDNSSGNSKSDTINKQAITAVKEQVQIHKDTIEDAEKKLKEAQNELLRLKKDKLDKIQDAKRKLVEDEQRLMRLRRGENI